MMKPTTMSASAGGERPVALMRVLPGFLVCVTVALASQFLSDHYGAPAMLMALLIGIAFHFLAEEGRAVPGIAMTSRTVLRIGVALLGVRMSAELLMTIGPATIGLVAVSYTHLTLPTICSV